ncbi:MAG: hypothetical protein EA398_14940 [Deltaproteobacteria bacterium]|nr:MAG: hypothetical protein EA398_14940 [Deltaproteobacteria bacterium]
MRADWLLGASSPAALEAWLGGRFDAEVEVVLVWRDVPSPAPWPEPRLHVVVAQDMVRMTGLRDWRDAVEGWWDAGEAGRWWVVAEEVGRYARRLRRGHGGAWSLARTEPDWAMPGVEHALAEVTAEVPEAAVTWWPGETPPALRSVARGTGPGLEELDDWVRGVRGGSFR